MKTMKRKKIILQEIKELLQSNFPGEIDKIILFGSQVKGKTKKYSDYDILIIMKNDCNWEIQEKIYDLLYDVDLKYDIITDIKTIAKNKINYYLVRAPFLHEALETGVEI